MALITCVECENKISDLAKNCPNCGAPVEISKKTPCFECGNLLDNGVTVCKSCGVDQSMNPDNIISNSTTQKLEQKIEYEPTAKKAKDESIINNKSEGESSKSTKEEKKTETNSESQTSTHNEPKRNASPPKHPIQEKKSGCLKPILITGLILVVLGFVGYSLLPDDAKKELFEALGIENSSIARQDLEAYINSEEVYHRQTIFGKWEISLALYNTHESITIRHVDIKFLFSDFDETRTFSKNMKPDKTFGTVIIEKFDGHNSASYFGYEIVDARE
jgi:hypothetical protein